jgi:hypothetical protein
MRKSGRENEKNPPNERTTYERIPQMTIERRYETKNIVPRVPRSEVRISEGDAQKRV